MILTISVTPFAICISVSATFTTGLIGRLLFLMVVLSHFLLPALRSPPGLLLLLHLRHLLPRRTLILGGIDPFWWCQKGREISGSYFWVVFLCMYLDISLLFVWTCVCGHVLCFWFWGWHEPPILYGHFFIMIWQLSLLSPCGIYGWLSIASCTIFVPTFYHSLWRLEVFMDGWR